MYDKSYWSDHYMMHDQDDEDEEEGDDAFNNSNSDSGEQDDREESFFESEPWPFYREGSADDKPQPEDTTSLGGLLRLLLLKKDPDLPFAGNKELFSANPKLQVDGIGSILLPLDADQAQKLRKEYDASTNSEEQKQVWEIDGEYVKFEKPTWWKKLWLR